MSVAFHIGVIGDDDYDEPAANDDEEVTALECWYVDRFGRKLFCVVGYNGATCETEWIDAFDENGIKVDCDTDTREAIAVEALR